MRPILRCLSIAGTLCVALATSGAADACTTLDRGCSARSSAGITAYPQDDVGGVLQDTLDAADDAVSGVVDDVGGASTGVVDDVGDAATGAIDGVTGATPPLPGVEPPGSLPPPLGEDPSDPPRDRDVRHRGRGDRRAAVVGHGSSPPAPVVRRQPAEGPVMTSTSSAAAEFSSRDPVRFDDAIAAALPSFFALGALFGLVLAFVAVQAWVDRRDPRLAVAPSVDEIVPFR